jgi:hypothetical protein
MDLMTNKGERFSELEEKEKLFLVFLRHFGCTFCRETMAELARQRHEVEGMGFKIVLVHMVQPDIAADILHVYDLGDLSHISDVHQRLYRRFGLGKTTIKSLMGIPNWWRAFVAGILKGHLVGKPAGDPFQMPGVFVMERKKILNTFTYRYVSDLPNFARLAQVA